MKILTINCGSSSIKYKLFSMPRALVLHKGAIEHIGEKGTKVPDHFCGLKLILEGMDGIDAVGHRVVHGAQEFREPVRINAGVVRKIRQCSAIAPLHNPANLTGIEACTGLRPGTPQVAVFDTAFHQTLPDYAYLYGLPYELYRRAGVRKYGFHGTSHEYVAREAARLLKRPLVSLKLITCHLGNGCSITAIKKGVSVDTSMGFTPLEGLIMGTRCGDIDPALVTYLMRTRKMRPDEVDALLNKASGLKGISGVSNDMRMLSQKEREGHKRSRLALAMFVYRIRKYIGAYTAVLGGCDAVVFTAGIGEHKKDIRQRVCRNLFSHMRKQPRILVVPTDEELMIARQTHRVLRQKRKK
ncbi:MAG: acetate kinase [Candidatus Omnitrophica bacterium]|nr:acetate kinase [Candidatus Omnitrophota bacterium]